MATFTDVYKETTTSETLTIGRLDKPGKLGVSSTYIEYGQDGSIRGKRAWNSFYYDGATGNLNIGDAQSNLYGSIILTPWGTGKQAILLDGKNSTISVGGGNDGDLRLIDRKAKEAIVLDAANSSISVSTNGIQTVAVDGLNANITLGGGLADGDLILKNRLGNNAIVMSGGEAGVLVGGVGTPGIITVNDSNNVPKIKITGVTGDIEFLNADFAEEFEVCEKEIDAVVPGSVMILNEESKLVPCSDAYDPKVVGIIAGAGSYKPAIVMDKNGGKNRLPVAMIGKVYCLVDADISPVQVGDMLTTSGNSGHAMKVTDRSMAFGTVIGKALSGLPKGKGLIPVLVNLQ